MAALEAPTSTPVQDLAYLSAADWNSYSGGVKVKQATGEPRLTAPQKGKLGYVFQVLQALGSPPAPPGAPAASTSAAASSLVPATPSAPPPERRLVKMSSLISQADESTVEEMSVQDFGAAVAKWQVTYGTGRPDPELEPGADQLAALRKLVKEGQPPYAVFAIFGPHSHRLQRRMRMNGCKFATDGTITPIEITGPNSLDAWRGSYDLWANAMLMLNIIDLGPLDSYRKTIEQLHSSLGASAWPFIYQCDVRARLERLVRLQVDV